MDAGKTSRYLFHDVKNDYTISRKDKFELVSCAIKGIHCKKVLPEINELYAESELARINKEYQKSAELLQSAYVKTQVLKESACVSCVDFFQTSITKTMEDMQEEVYDMSVGFFHKKRYEKVYVRMCNFLRKMKLFRLGETNIFITKKTTPISMDL